MDEELISSEGHYEPLAGTLRSRNLQSTRPPQESGEEDARQRLQQLIRSFAYDAVGPGILVMAQCAELAAGGGQARLRLDRKLSSVELWSLAASGGGGGEEESDEEGIELLLQVSLRHVEQILKVTEVAGTGTVAEADGAAGGVAERGLSLAHFSTQAAPLGAKGQQGPQRGGPALSVVRAPGPAGALPELRITFDSAAMRDRAYTCLRIFQMSVAAAEG